MDFINRSQGQREPLLPPPSAAKIASAWQLSSSRQGNRWGIKPNVTHTKARYLWQTISQKISSNTAPKAVLLNLAHLLGEALDADGCWIADLRMDQTIGLSAGWHPKNHLSTSYNETPRWLLQKLAHSQDLQPTVLTAEDISKLSVLCSSRGKFYFSSQPDFSSTTVLTIKTVFRSRVNGVIVLTRSPEHPWKKSDTCFLQTLSQQLAIAISQIQLEYLMHQQIKYQGLINHVTCAIRNTWDLEQLFELTADGLISALEICRVMILTLKYADPAQKQRFSQWVPKAKAVVECVRTTADESAKDNQPHESLAGISNSAKPSFWVSDCPILQPLLIEKASPLAIANLHQVQDTRLTPMLDLSGDITPEFCLEQFPALFLIPIENQDTTLGFLALQHDQPRAWAPEEATFVKTIADHLSTAILQARTIRHIQALVDERTAQLQHSLDVQAKLYETMRHQVEQLRLMNRRQEEFLSTVSHELLTPLTSMTVAIRLLKQATLPPERQDKYLTILEQQCHQETTLINDLLTLQKLESGQLSLRFQPIDLRGLIRDLAQPFESVWKQKQLTLTLNLPNSPVNLCTDLDSLNRILTELLTNAGKYAQSDTAVILNINQTFEQRQNKIALTLQNIGPGITTDETAIIFSPFVRGEGVTKQAIPGTGLGLALVKGLVEHLNGAIAVQSQPLAEGQIWETCFKVTLPQSPDLSLV